MSIDVEMSILEKYKLSPNELFTIRVMLLTQEEDSEYLYKFLTIPESYRGDFRTTLISLQEKGIILKSCKIPNKGERFDPYEIEFNKIFTKGFHKCSFDLGKELFEAYPQFATINGAYVSLRGVSKKFDSLEDFFRAYGKAISWNPETHKEILELIKWGAEKGIINYSLSSFLIDRRWEDLRTLRDGGEINYDTLTVL